MPLKGKENFKKLTSEGYERINDNLRGVYLQGLFNIVKGTPVDEGRARNNWFLSMDAPSNKSTTSKAKGLGAIRQLRQMPKLVLNKKMFLGIRYEKIISIIRCVLFSVFIRSRNEKHSGV